MYQKTGDMVGIPYGKMLPFSASLAFPGLSERRRLMTRAVLRGPLVDPLNGRFAVSPSGLRSRARRSGGVPEWTWVVQRPKPPKPPKWPPCGDDRSRCHDLISRRATRRRAKGKSSSAALTATDLRRPWQAGPNHVATGPMANPGRMEHDGAEEGEDFPFHRESQLIPAGPRSQHRNPHIIVLFLFRIVILEEKDYGKIQKAIGNW